MKHTSEATRTPLLVLLTSVTGALRIYAGYVENDLYFLDMTYEIVNTFNYHKIKERLKSLATNSTS